MRCARTLNKRLESKEKLFAGLIWTVRGLTLGDEAILYILSVLATQPKGIKQARMLRGVVVQAKSAFKFSSTEILRFSQLLSAVSACIDAYDQTSKWWWTVEARDAVVELCERLANCERRYTNPDNILSDKQCIATLGDADPDAVVATLWLIATENANDITPDDFQTDSASASVSKTQ